VVVDAVVVVSVAVEVVVGVVVVGVDVVVGVVVVVTGLVVAGAVVRCWVVTGTVVAVVLAAVVGVVVVERVLETVPESVLETALETVETAGRLMRGSELLLLLPLPLECVSASASAAPPASRISVTTSAGKSTLEVLRRIARGGAVRTRVTAVVSNVWSPARAATSAAPSAGRLAASFRSVASAVDARPAGASGRTLLTAGAGSSRFIRTNSIALSALNGSRPVSIRKRMTPNE
jgi:hypothetical protein